MPWPVNFNSPQHEFSEQQTEKGRRGQGKGENGAANTIRGSAQPVLALL